MVQRKSKEAQRDARGAMPLREEEAIQMSDVPALPMPPAAARSSCCRRGVYARVCCAPQFVSAKSADVLQRARAYRDVPPSRGAGYIFIVDAVYGHARRTFAGICAFFAARRFACYAITPAPAYHAESAPHYAATTPSSTPYRHGYLARYVDACAARARLIAYYGAARRDAGHTFCR